MVGSRSLLGWALGLQEPFGVLGGHWEFRGLQEPLGVLGWALGVLGGHWGLQEPLGKGWGISPIPKNEGEYICNVLNSTFSL